jgi:SAM-dependent methyltransferase
MPSEQAWKSYRRLLAKYAEGAKHEQYTYAATLAELVRPGITWLDAGCGHNVIAPWLKDSAKQQQILLSRPALVVGCDVDPVSLTKESPLHRVGCDLEALSFRDSSFDLISCNMVVEHLARPDAVFREFYRILRPGGTVLVLTPNLWHWTMLVSRLTPHWLHVMARKKIMGSDEDDVFPTLYRSNTPGSLRSGLGAAGFDPIEVRLLPSQPHLVGTGPLLYAEFAWYSLSLKVPLIREVLMAIATKKG